MRFLRLATKIIPLLYIKYCEQAEEPGIEEDGSAVTWIITKIHLKDGTSINVDEDFDEVSDMLIAAGA